jgi:tetratricopeptide (TPR) repeat protein
VSDEESRTERNITGTSYYYGQVDFYLNSGEIALALYQASRNIAYNEEDPAVYINRARVYEKLGKLEKAILDLKEALRLAPDNQDVLSHLESISKQGNKS